MPVAPSFGEEFEEEEREEPDRDARRNRTQYKKYDTRTKDKRKSPTRKDGRDGNAIRGKYVAQRAKRKGTRSTGRR